MFNLAFRNVFRNRWRFILSAFVVAVTSFLLVYATAQISGVSNTLAKGMSDTLTGHIQIKPKSAPIDFFENPSSRRLELISAEDLDRIMKTLLVVEGIEAVTPRIRFGSDIGDDERSVPALVMAVDPAHEGLVVPDLGKLLGPLSDSGSALISKYLADKLKKGKGEEVVVLTHTSKDTVNAGLYRIAGFAEAPVLIDEFMNSLFIVDINSARKILYMSDGATEMAIRLKPGYETQIKRVIADIESHLSQPQRDYLAVYSYTDVAKSVGNISGIATGIGIIQVGVIMLVMLVIILIVTKMGLYERRVEIGTLISIGMTRGRLVSLFMSEVTIKVLIGYGVGLIFALLFLQGIRENGGVKAQTQVEQYLYGGKIMYPIVDSERILFGFLLVMFAAVLTTAATCWKASGEEVVQLLTGKK
jgi:ABC-type lipoprotein release transport system permease subunit